MSSPPSLPSTSQETLTTVLRSRTRVAHARSDRAVLRHQALAFADARVWLSLLTQFHRVFAAIDAALVLHATHPHVAPLVPLLAPLHTPDAIARDIAFFAAATGLNRGGEGKSAGFVGEVFPPTVEYVQRVGELCARDPKMAVVYAHTMYMGLLAGGQVLGRMQRVAMNLEAGGAGGAIFEVGPALEELGVASVAELRERVRKAVDALAIPREEWGAMVEEKAMIFERNNEVIVWAVAQAPRTAYLALAWNLAVRVLSSVWFLTGCALLLAVWILMRK